MLKEQLEIASIRKRYTEGNNGLTQSHLGRDFKKVFDYLYEVESELEAKDSHLKLAVAALEDVIATSGPGIPCTLVIKICEKALEEIRGKEKES